MKPPAVYKAIAAVTAELSRSGIAKNSHNEQEGWAFRGIDDVYNALSPLLAKHKLCILPRILERDVQQRRSGGELLHHVALKVAFQFVSAADGSSHSVKIWGEGADGSDKATNKALAAVYKYAAFQVFCIPTAGQVDGDGETLVPGVTDVRAPVLEPVQGWNAWVGDVTDMIGGCETLEAVARVQTTYRRELDALSSYDAAAYPLIGKAVAGVKQKLAMSIDRAEQPSLPDALSRVPASLFTRSPRASRRNAETRPVLPLRRKVNSKRAADARMPRSPQVGRGHQCSFPRCERGRLNVHMCGPELMVASGSSRRIGGASAYAEITAPSNTTWEKKSLKRL